MIPLVPCVRCGCESSHPTPIAPIAGWATAADVRTMPPWPEADDFLVVGVSVRPAALCCVCYVIDGNPPDMEHPGCAVAWKALCDIEAALRDGDS